MQPRGSHLSPPVPGHFLRWAPAHALLHAEDLGAVARLHAGPFSARPFSKGVFIEPWPMWTTRAFGQGYSPSGTVKGRQASQQPPLTLGRRGSCPAYTSKDEWQARRRHRRPSPSRIGGRQYGDSKIPTFSRIASAFLRTPSRRTMAYQTISYNGIVKAHAYTYAS